MNDVTRILSAIDQGDPRAAQQLLPLVYDELRTLATQKVAQEKPGQTLQATALVHEAYLRLVGSQNDQKWHSRGHFFAAAAEAMRRILVDNARRKLAEVHGGGQQRCEFSEGLVVARTTPDQLVALDESLSRLADEDRPAADLVQLHVFAGLSIDEAAQALGVSRATAYRHWTYARAWLRAELLDDGDVPKD
jgi:RNA polymerase sigma factor (TIGR02999 family)